MGICAGVPLSSTTQAYTWPLRDLASPPSRTIQWRCTDLSPQLRVGTGASASLEASHSPADGVGGLSSPIPSSNLLPSSYCPSASPSQALDSRLRMPDDAAPSSPAISRNFDWLLDSIAKGGLIVACCGEMFANILYV